MILKATFDDRNWSKSALNKNLFSILFTVCIISLSLTYNIVYSQRAHPYGGKQRVKGENIQNKVNPDIATDSYGNSLVVWEVENKKEIWVQKFDLNGGKVGGELMVTDSGAHPSIAVDSVGHFVVMWIRDNVNQGKDLFIKIYNQKNEILLEETSISQIVEGDISLPRIWVNSKGDFAVVWNRYNATNQMYNGTYVSYFNSEGKILVNELKISEEESSHFIAGDFSFAGDLLLVKEEISQEGVYSYIGQKYDNTGAKNGNEFILNISENALSSLHIDLTFSHSGQFIVVWESFLEGVSITLPGNTIVDTEIFAQVYDENGLKVGDEILVNSFQEGPQIKPYIDIDKEGDFMVVWESPYSNLPLRFQKFDSNGSPMGDELGLATSSKQELTKLVLLENDFLLFWDEHLYANQISSYTQRFSLEGKEIGSPKNITSMLMNPISKFKQSIGDQGSHAIVWVETGIIKEEAKLWLFFDSPVNEGQTIQIPTGENQIIEDPQVAVDTYGNIVVVWSEKGDKRNDIFLLWLDDEGNAKINPIQINQPNLSQCHFPRIDVDESGLFSISWINYESENNDQVYLSLYKVQGDEFKSIRKEIIVKEGINTDSSPPILTMSSTGITGVSWKEKKSNSSSYYLSTYNHDGEKLKDFSLEELTDELLNSNLKLAMDFDGDVIAVWHQDRGTGTGEDIYALRLDRDGNPLDQFVRVNTITEGDQTQADVAVDADGAYTIVWQSNTGIKGKQYDKNGNVIGDDFFIVENTNSTNPLIGMSPEGDFSVIWSEGGNQLYYQKFSMNEAPAPSDDPYLISEGVAGSNTDVKVALDYLGNSIVIWLNNKNGELNLMGQLYDQDQRPKSSSFIINDEPLTGGGATKFEVAMNFDGSFGVTWTKEIKDKSNDEIDHILGKLYDRDGKMIKKLQIAPEDPESADNVSYKAPKIAIDHQGDVVLVWEQVVTSEMSNILMRLFDLEGNPTSSIIRVNDEEISGHQNTEADVSMDEQGNFVITWSRATDYKNNYNRDVFKKRFYADGTAVEDEVLVADNVNGGSLQFHPCISVNAEGDYYIVWFNGINASQGELLGASYSKEGERIGPIFQITSQSGTIAYPDIASDQLGNFTVTWTVMHSYPDLFEVYAKSFNNKGIPRGEAYLVNTHEHFIQDNSCIGMDEDGDFIIVWEDTNDGATYQVYGRVFTIPPPEIQGDEISLTDKDEDTFVDVEINWEGDYVVMLLENQEIELHRKLPENNQKNIQYLSAIQATNADLSMDRSGEYSVVWVENYQNIKLQSFKETGEKSEVIQVNSASYDLIHQVTMVSDANGHLNICWLGEIEGDSKIYLQQVSQTGILEFSQEKVVNNLNTKESVTLDVASDDQGNMIVVWNDYDDSSYEIRGQLFNANGFRTDQIITIGSSSDMLSSPSVDMDIDGDFSVVWVGVDSDETGIYGQRFTPKGEPQGPIKKINYFESGRQQNPHLSMDADGDMLVLWESNHVDGQGFDIYSRYYLSNGTVESMSEFILNQKVDMNQVTPKGAMDADGDAVLVWKSEKETNYDIIVQKLVTSNESPKIPELEGDLEFELNSKSSIVIDNSILKVKDLDATQKMLRHTITKTPVLGTIFLEETPLELNDSFSQDDVVQGKVLYKHQRSGEQETFTLTLDDGSNTIEENFTLNIIKPLPVELLYIRTVLLEEGIRVEWATATEIDHNYFELERSFDGVNFSPIHQVQGTGNSNTLKKYEYIDSSPTLGVNYYRLKQTDLNGEYTYSSVVNSRNSVDKQFDFIMLPTMVSDHVIRFKLEGHTDIEPIGIRLFDISGSLRLDKELEIPSNELFELDFTGEAGVYLMMVYQGTNISSKRIVVE